MDVSRCTGVLSLPPLRAWVLMVLLEVENVADPPDWANVGRPVDVTFDLYPKPSDVDFQVGPDVGPIRAHALSSNSRRVTTQPALSISCRRIRNSLCGR